mmetsp:Transcript_5315/g.15718  ORF Transcript_5315/g.15718 Transcript_5315/m.15718 type:complete len:100 (-) Transcript_5315:112-411(-)
MTWHTAFGLRAPSEFVAEGRLRVGDGAPSAELCVPLLKDGRECGQAVVTVQCTLEALLKGGVTSLYEPACVQAKRRWMVPLADLDGQDLPLAVEPAGRF